MSDVLERIRSLVAERSRIDAALAHTVRDAENEHGFGIDRDQTGRWHTYRPDGTEILVIRPADDAHLARAG